MQSMALGGVLPEPSADTRLSVPISVAVETYLSEVRRFRARKTMAACEHMLRLFAELCPKKPIQAISRHDLLDPMSALKGRDLSPRTIHNHIARINTLLRSYKVTGLLSAATSQPTTRKHLTHTTLINFECC